VASFPGCKEGGKLSASCGLGMRLHWLVLYSYICSLIPGLSPLHNDSEH